MLQAVWVHTIVEVTIRGGQAGEFSADLARFQDAIQAKDREFHPERKLWVVKNPHEYLHIDFIRAAQACRAAQLELF